jgi:hypothetical protein
MMFMALCSLATSEKSVLEVKHVLNGAASTCARSHSVGV